MSKRNGDRARFQKNRKRKLHHRERVRALMTGLRKETEAPGATGRSVAATPGDAASAEASLAMQDEGGPMRTGD